MLAMESEELPFNIPGIKLYRVHDKDELAQIEKENPNFRFAAYSKQLITKNGNKFSPAEIDLALKEINYIPKNKTEAITAATKIALMKEDHPSELLNSELIKDKTARIHIGDIDVLYENELTDFSEDKYKKVWKALIRNRYIDKNGIIQSRFNPKNIGRFHPPIRLTKKEKEAVFDELRMSLSSAIYPKIIKKIHPPKVKKKKGYYEVILFGYKRAQAGWPQEWVIKYKVLVGLGIYNIEERKKLWTVKSRYKW